MVIPMADTPIPVRERIMERLKSNFEAVTDLGGEPGLTWESVVRAPIGDNERKLKSAVSLQEGREVCSVVSVAEDKQLDVSVEFEIKSFAGESAATFQNYVLAHVLKTLAGDRQLGGLCLHVRVTGDDMDIQSEGDPRVGGIVFATIHYRHREGDPCRLLGE